VVISGLNCSFCENLWNVSWVTGTKVLDRQVICGLDTASIGGGGLGTQFGRGDSVLIGYSGTDSVRGKQFQSYVQRLIRNVAGFTRSISQWMATFCRARHWEGAARVQHHNADKHGIAAAVLGTMVSFEKTTGRISTRDHPCRSTDRDVNHETREPPNVRPGLSPPSSHLNQTDSRPSLPVVWACARPGTSVVGSCHDGLDCWACASGTGKVTFTCSPCRCLVFNVSNVIFLRGKWGATNSRRRSCRQRKNRCSRSQPC
jgi:hypothetical protein